MSSLYMYGRALPFLLPFLIPFGTVRGLLKDIETGGATYFVFLPVVVTFVVVPILDLLIGRDTTNWSEEESRRFSKLWIFRILPLLWVPLQMALVVWGAWVFTTWEMPLHTRIGFLLAVGLSTGAMGINIAHELIHRHEWFEKGSGYALLSSVCYMHWGVEHVYGHHRHVSTPRDPASSRLGESLWAFLPRTVWGTIVSSWEICADMQIRKGKSPWGLGNPMWAFILLPLAWAVGLGIAFGPWAVAFFFAQSLVAIWLLETINYVEHYGLERRQNADGRFETVTPLHSWNSSEWLTNHFLFNLQRHSDHHAHASRRYPALRHFDEAPQLPTGYAGMILVAAVPPLWFRLMDPMVADFRERLSRREALSEAN